MTIFHYVALKISIYEKKKNFFFIMLHNVFKIVFWSKYYLYFIVVHTIYHNDKLFLIITHHQ